MLRSSSLLDRAGEPPPRRAPALKVPKPPLGIHCKIGAPPPADWLSWPVQIQRFFLQSIAREIMPETRLSCCLRRRISGVEGIEILKGDTRAYFKGLQTCNSVWGDPVCSCKISEKRRVELEQDINTWEEMGGVVLMATFTVRHHSGMFLLDVLGGLGEAFKLMKHRKPYKSLARTICLKGSIRALEVTWGEDNGWHAHFHVLLFLMPPESSRVRILCGQESVLLPYGAGRWAPSPPGVMYVAWAIQDVILPQWQKACVDVGLPEPDHHGVKVTGGPDVGNYIGKWGKSLEMTKGHIKKGRNGRFTPWDFLRNYAVSELPEKREKWGLLFREYFNDFKGKRQLVWSDGLKALLRSEQRTDEELASEVNEMDQVLASLSWRDFRLIRDREQRGQVLEVAYNQGPEAVKAFINHIKELSE